MVARKNSLSGKSRSAGRQFNHKFPERDLFGLASPSERLYGVLIVVVQLSFIKQYDAGAGRLKKIEPPKIETGEVCVWGPWPWTQPTPPRHGQGQGRQGH